MIKQKGLEKTATAISNLLSHAQYTMDGTKNNIPIHQKKLENNILTVYVLFDNTISGNITLIELIDVDGEVYADQPDNINKIDDKLVLATFKFTIVEVFN